MNNLTEYQQIIDQQIDMEHSMIEEGVTRYRKRVIEAQQHGQETRNRPVEKLMQESIPLVAAGIQKLIDDATSGKAGRRSTVVRFLIDADVDTVAFLTARGILNTLSTGGSVTSQAAQLGRTVVEHIAYREWKAKDKSSFMRTKKKLEKASHQGYARTVMQYYAKKAGYVAKKLTEEERVTLGMFLIELFVDTTGLVKMVQRSVDEPPHLMATEKTKAWLKKSDERMEVLSPVLLPMIMPPMDWGGSHDGGYMSIRLPLVKTSNRAYLQELDNMHMPVLYKAINAIQRTPWRIHTKVLEVMTHLWDADMGLGVLPGLDEVEMVPLPCNEEDIPVFKQEHPDLWRDWKSAQRDAYRDAIRSQSHAVSVGMCISTATKMKDYESIYFPHQLDWRGRMYPAPAIFSPQGADYSKGLLEFAEGKPLGEQGAHWLKVHLANSYGVDKVSFEDRVKWVDDHATQISLCSIDPLTYRFWMDADAPWQFLAAAFEFDQYQREGNEMISRIPVGVDGSCNGLQHLSAMLLDTFGATSTNLVNADKPADIYGIVAKQVADCVVQDVSKGADLAADWDGKVTRSVVKRNVMTVSYGATSFGMLEQLREDLTKATNNDIAGFLGLPRTAQVFHHLRYLSGLIQQSIGTTVVAAPKVMDWLKEVSSVAAENNLPIRWETPSGFIVQQAYYKRGLKRLNAIVGNYRIQTTLRTTTNKVDAAKSGLSISPNFTHSMDAAHMALTVCQCEDNGITSFAMVHDSYGCHACDIPVLNAALRDEFIKMYSVNQLEQFATQLRAQLPIDLALGINPPPEQGDFDLEQVRNARYFFA